MPKVSICIPTYVQTKFLKRNLESILLQTYQDYEIVVTDDTPDNGIEKFLANYDFGGRLVYHKNTERLGSPENWNRAMQISSGEFIKILHHDDWFYKPESLQKFVDLLEQDPQVDFAFSGTNIVSDSGIADRIHNISSQKFNELIATPQLLYLGNFIGAPSATICRRDVVLNYDVKLKWLVDLECYIRVIKKSRKINFTPEPLISTITDAGHSITSECIDNKEVELFEYSYLYDKLRSDVPRATQAFMQDELVRIIRKYNVKTLGELRSFYGTGPVPVKVMKYFGKKLIRRVMGKSTQV